MKTAMNTKQATTMSTLVKNTGDLDYSQPATRRAGFGLVPAKAVKQTEQIRRALMTMLLVLYPAMATAAVVIAALVYSGAGRVV